MSEYDWGRDEAVYDNYRFMFACARAAELKYGERVLANEIDELRRSMNPEELLSFEKYIAQGIPDEIRESLISWIKAARMFGRTLAARKGQFDARREEGEIADQKISVLCKGIDTICKSWELTGTDPEKFSRVLHDDFERLSRLADTVRASRAEQMSENNVLLRIQMQREIK